MALGELFDLARDMQAEHKGEAADKPPPPDMISAQIAIAEEWASNG